MPELATEKTAATFDASRHSSTEEDERSLLAGEGKEWIGSGAESLVFVHPQNPNKVITVNREGSVFAPIRGASAKELFYAHNILSTLFPHNFPRFYAAFDTDNPEVDPRHSGTVRERVMPKRTKSLIRRLQIQYPFSRVRRICKRMGFPLLVDSSNKKANFIVGLDGGEYYVDRIIVPDPREMGGAIPYMNENGYSDSDKAKVQKYIKRLHMIPYETHKRKPTQA